MKFEKLLLLLITLPVFANAQNPLRDPDWGINGYVRTALGPNNEAASSVVIQSDGKVVAAGTQTDNPTFGPQRFGLARYLTDGTLDSTFGLNGKVMSAFESQNFCNVIALQPDGKIVAAGQSSSGASIARYLSDGNVDSTFGANGFTTVASANASSISDIYILANGQILAAGTSQIAGGFNFEVKLMRFSSNGILDNTFGNNGVSFPPSGFITTAVAKMLVQNDGKIVLGGRGTFNPGSGNVVQLFLMRVSDLGFIDTTFANNGVVTYPTALNINDMTFDVNNNIVAVGEIGTNQQGTSGDVVVMRFTSTGLPDLTFGTNGSTSVSVDSYADYASAVLLQSDGKILLGGSFFNFAGGSGTDCLFLRFFDNGQLDSTFGVNGVFKAGVCGGTDRILDMDMTADNRIIVSGSANCSVNFDFVVGRFITDQTLSFFDPRVSNNEMQVFPNPAHQSATITVTIRQASTYNIRIYDVAGKLVKSVKENTMLQQGENTVNADVKTLEPGVYMIVATSNEQVLTSRLIRQ